MIITYTRMGLHVPAKDSIPLSLVEIGDGISYACGTYQSYISVLLIL